MSGVSAIWYLLKTNAPVIAVVPAERIKAGDLPLNTVLPAISVTQVDSVPLNQLQINETPKVHVDRVQVSVLVKVESTSRSLLKLVLAACPSQYGSVNGISVLGITPDIEGPDFSDESVPIYTGSRDFFVRWHS